MALLQTLLEILMTGLLGVMLAQAIRMERGRATLKRDRAELERMIQVFDDAQRQAETSIERLRTATESAARLMARHIESGANLKDDLLALIERGERLHQPQAALTYADAEMAGPGAVASATPRVRSPAERELLRALRVTR